MRLGGIRSTSVSPCASWQGGHQSKRMIFLGFCIIWEDILALTTCSWSLVNHFSYSFSPGMATANGSSAGLCGRVAQPPRIWCHWFPWSGHVWGIPFGRVSWLKALVKSSKKMEPTKHDNQHGKLNCYSAAANYHLVNQPWILNISPCIGWLSYQTMVIFYDFLQFFHINWLWKNNQCNCLPDVWPMAMAHRERTKTKPAHRGYEKLDPGKEVAKAEVAGLTSTEQLKQLQLHGTLQKIILLFVEKEHWMNQMFFFFFFFKFSMFDCQVVYTTIQRPFSNAQIQYESP